MIQYKFSQIDMNKAEMQRVVPIGNLQVCQIVEDALNTKECPGIGIFLPIW